MSRNVVLAAIGAAAIAGLFATAASADTKAVTSPKPHTATNAVSALNTPTASPFAGRSIPAPIRIQTMVSGAKSQVRQTITYDPTYARLAYPGGDVPIQTGVCTDVVIRAFRTIGVDLQVLVHEDMVKHFSVYPRTGINHPDANIDHRRVKNLVTFFRRQGAAAPVTQNPSDYLPGDVVMWDVSGLAHTGLVSDVLVPGTTRFMAVHNIGDGAQLEDVLFAFPITAHFRYVGGIAT